MAEIVGEVFGACEGEECGFPEYKGAVRVLWVVFLARFWSGLIRLGEEEGERDIPEVVDEEERELSEVAEDWIELEEERQGGDGVVGAWDIFRIVPIFVGLRVGSIGSSDYNGYVIGMYAKDGVAMSWVRVGCVTSSVRSWAEGEVPFNGDSCPLILISPSSIRFSFLRLCEMYFRGRPVWELSLCSVFFGGGLVDLGG